jgi:SPP1 gp7 family putative phage head morphogenesis protein
MKNLAKYNAWKRSTLDRLTSKYRMMAVKVFERNLKAHEGAIIYALEQGVKIFPVHGEMLDLELTKIYLAHLHDTYKVGISDGMREITPEKTLSTWEQWHWSYPVENTITLMGEKTFRENVFKSMLDRALMGRKRKTIAKIIKLEKARYFKNVQTVFKEIAKQYYDDPENTSPRSVYLDLFKSVIKKTDSHTETVFRTETTRYFNEARVVYFKTHTDTDFVQIVAITDGRISDICECRDGYVIPIARAGEKQFKPPFHFNCRSVQSPLITDTKSAQNDVRVNLGAEFGTIKSDLSDLEFVGKRKRPDVPIPENFR